jgi:ABC-type branched-subunit amino acid transport system ATPase component
MKSKESDRPILEVRNATKAFLGLVALSHVSFAVRDNIYGVIGPNGAGKTTLFNLITRVLDPTGGEILFDGTPITSLPAHAIARLGIGRTFQNVRLFAHQSVIENVVIGTYRNTKAGFLRGLFATGYARAERETARREAMRCLDFVGLTAQADQPAGTLPFGRQRLLELARALAMVPRLLLLDEPAAGLNDRETEELAGLIQRLPEQGITVVLVEHNMDLMMSVAERILVLNYGQVLAEGKPDEIRAERAVIDAYLGVEDVA